MYVRVTAYLGTVKNRLFGIPCVSSNVVEKSKPFSFRLISSFSFNAYLESFAKTSLECGTTTVIGSEKRLPRSGSFSSTALTVAKCTPGGNPRASNRTEKVCPPRSVADSNVMPPGHVTQSSLAVNFKLISNESSSSISLAVLRTKQRMM